MALTYLMAKNRAFSMVYLNMWLSSKKVCDSSILTEVASEGQNGESINKEGVQLAKAKRRVTRPAYLKDYA
ncbi:hypothetical protein HKD37_U058497 [Glycine soja]